MTQQALRPYLDSLSPWQEIVAKKHLLFDNDAIATISGYKADSIYARFQSLEPDLTKLVPYSQLLQN